MKQTENFIQQQIVLYYNKNFRNNIIAAIPNGGKRDAREAKTLKNTGLLKGFSDLIIIEPDRLVFVEVKTNTGYQSDDQKKFADKIHSLGYEYWVVRSLEDFITKLLHK